MPVVRVRLTGSQDAVASLLKAVEGIEGLQHMEEVGDLEPHMRDDSSSAGLTDDEGADFHDLKLHFDSPAEARPRARSARGGLALERRGSGICGAVLSGKPGPCARARSAHGASGETGSALQVSAMRNSRSDSAVPGSADIEMDVAAVGLVYVTDIETGIRRRRQGSAFAYRRDDDTEVTDPRTLQRIAKLAIPPAYEDVWICALSNGHLQATGYDARRRKQYRYHARWHSLRDHGKFDRVIEFGDALPRLRRRLRADLAQRGLSRDKVLALLVTVMSQTLIRVGNDRYLRDNGSYGLTTLRNRHVRPLRGRLKFQFRGKSGQEREVELDDRRLIRLVRRIQQLPGQRLFQYIDDDGAVHAIDSGLVNDYLREAIGGSFSAKDFRTFGATVRAAGLLACTPLPEAESAQRSAVAAVVKEVAAALGNTPAVCRGSYIHPGLLEGWLDGSLQAAISAQAPAIRGRSSAGRSPSSAPGRSARGLHARGRAAAELHGGIARRLRRGYAWLFRLSGAAPVIVQLGGSSGRPAAGRCYSVVPACQSPPSHAMTTLAPYPIGTPAQPWAEADVATWRARQTPAAQLRRRTCWAGSRPALALRRGAVRPPGLRARRVSAVGHQEPRLARRAALRAGYRWRARLRDQRRARRAAVRRRAGGRVCGSRQSAGRAVRQPVGLRAHPSLEPERARPEPLVPRQQPGAGIGGADATWSRRCAIACSCTSTCTKPPTATNPNSAPRWRRATASRIVPGEIPDGFYLVDDSEHPQPEFQQAIIAAVAKVTHIAPADAQRRDHRLAAWSRRASSSTRSRRSACAPASPTHATRRPPRSIPTARARPPEQCNAAQVAAVCAAIDFALR